MSRCKNNIIPGCCVLNLIFFLALLFPSCLVAGQDVTADGAGATVLIYHRFGETKYPSTNVSPERFREQLDFLKKNHYQVIPLTDLVASIKNKTPLPEKAVVITIDDGFRSIYDKAWPILKSFGYPFTVFPTMNGIDSNTSAYMTWDQVRELRQAGVDFQDHSYSHYRLTERPKGLDDAAYRAWIRADLQKGSELLAKKLGYKPRIFSIPYGEYNSVVLQEIKGLGYEAVMSQDPGVISADTDPFLMPREPILGKEWSSMSHFAEVLNHLDMPISDRQPDLDPLADGRVKRFGATLLYPDRYERESLGIYVTGLGWQRAELEGNTISIDNDKALSSHINRVTVSGKDKKTGRLAMRCWMVIK